MVNAREFDQCRNMMTCPLPKAWGGLTSAPEQGVMVGLRECSDSVCGVKMEVGYHTRPGMEISAYIF